MRRFRKDALGNLIVATGKKRLGKRRRPHLLIHVCHSDTPSELRRRIGLRWCRSDLTWRWCQRRESAPLIRRGAKLTEREILSV
jgi:hypothetical protein